tara:strand:+ start:28077 stop:29132 length:1056 start_codon:yes stop_codon:yes gene_type:complete
MKKNFLIEKRKVGLNQPTFLIAEIGSNHNRDKKTVKKLIQKAAEAGFDSVKFQIYDPAEIFSKKITTKDVKLSHFYGLKPWWKIARDKILMPREWFKEMFMLVRSFGMIPFSAIHRAEDCKFLLEYDLPAIKIASIDLTYHQLFKQLVKFKLPIILSSGMGDKEEINHSLKLMKKLGQKDLALLHCVSCYPPKPEEVNLNNINFLKTKYQIPIGFSDHSKGVATSVAAVALGAKIIEKHITLDKNFPGPDHPFALEPSEMKRLVKEVREIEKSMGNFERKPSLREIKNRKMIRRSIISKFDIKKGELISENKIKFARPGTGLGTHKSNLIVGKKAKMNIKAETILTLKHVK